jgi:hypothetical protein
MTDRDRIIHAPEFQAGMNRHTDKPLCWRAEDDGWACAAAATPDLQQRLLDQSPGCELCAAGQRAALLYWRYAAC